MAKCVEPFSTIRSGRIKPFWISRVLVTGLEGLNDRYVLPSGGNVNGILGKDYLNRHAAVIDWKHGCLYLRSK